MDKLKDTNWEDKIEKWFDVFLWSLGFGLSIYLGLGVAHEVGDISGLATFYIAASINTIYWKLP